MTQTVTDIKRQVETLETVAAVRDFIDTPGAVREDGSKLWPVRLDVPGQAVNGHAEYRAMLQEEFDAVLPQLNERIKERLAGREATARVNLKKLMGEL